MHVGLVPRMPRGWWMEEALAQDPGEPCPPLSTDTAADVVILGGGYTGMWTAYFLKERDPGIDVVLLERDICGGGPSGRNGGFVNALWDELPVLAERHGDREALALCRVAERSIEEIGVWCEAHALDAWYSRGGDLGVSTSAAQDGSWRENVETARRVGADDVYVELSEEEVADRCRSPIFRGGVSMPSAAHVQPARLARGLRRVLLERGVRIFEGTPVLRFRGGSRAEADTPGSRVTAGSAIVGLGAYAARLRRFRRAILPRGSYIVITAPAPQKIDEIGWTGGEGLYDFRSSLHYLRTTPDGRIAFGGASSRVGLGTGLGPRLDFDQASVARLVCDLHRWFPSFRDVPVECGWGGPIDVTGLHVPFFGTLPPGNVHFGLGFTGGGVGPCHLAGRILSGLALGVEDEYTRLQLVGADPKPFPPEPLRSPGAFLTHEAIVRKDDAEDEGGRPNPLVDLVARLPRRLGYNLGP
ncbi:MAG: NAD(P)/FAD-dependent oxidoreductase [Actinomycetota bacterium]